MAPEQHPDDVPEEVDKTVSSAKRKRLQQWFEQANVQMGQENYDYANEWLTKCVAGDPGNLIYLQSFLSNLKKKYNNNRKGSNLAMIRIARPRSAAKRAAAHEDWEAAIKAGLDALKHNPWDFTTLSQMAKAADALGHHDAQLTYLKTALEANPKDPEVNKLCAAALKERGLFDQAIACWHRVEQAKPGDEEAARQIASLAVEKTIAKGGYEDPDRRSEALEGDRKGPEQQVVELTAEERLEQEIARHPKDVARYVELGELHMTRERYDRAEEVFTRAFEISGGDEDVRERWEDAQLRRLRQGFTKADRLAKKTGSEEDKKRSRELKTQLDAKELDVHKNRVQRYPNNLGFRYDLGVRYQLSGNFKEAIAEYQQAQRDPRNRGRCMLALGQCFQQIKQYRLAMGNYESAIEEIPDRDPENKKLALYLAGRLATALKDYDTGEKHLTTLAGLDFAYRDVSTLLEKIAKVRETAKGGAEKGEGG
jgi:tetratricopeptide (TPR) repeat protein